MNPVHAARHAFEPLHPPFETCSSSPRPFGDQVVPRSRERGRERKKIERERERERREREREREIGDRRKDREKRKEQGRGERSQGRPMQLPPPTAATQQPPLP